jgi:hypothetical protein
LQNGVQEQERKKGKLHQVFRLSFDAKEIMNEQEINQVLDYMHHNPVHGKWKLENEYINYLWSSAMYYEQEMILEVPVTDYRMLISGLP